MTRLIRWAIIIGISAFVIWILNRYRKCRSIGKESGKDYECSPFCVEPTFLVAEDVIYTMREGKCYEVTDYGSKMSFREVEEYKCR